MGLAFDASRGGRDKWIPYYAERFKAVREATERGAWGLFWSFPRTAHWTACALDDAGWEVVSSIEHIHGQGWPKGKSQLKPAKEIWWLVRWGGVTPLQIDRCRVRRSAPIKAQVSGGSKLYDHGRGAKGGHLTEPHDAGSWPPDLVLSHCPSCKEVGARKVQSQPALSRGRSARILLRKERSARVSCSGMAPTAPKPSPPGLASLRAPVGSPRSPRPVVRLRGAPAAARSGGGRARWRSWMGSRGSFKPTSTSRGASTARETSL